MRDIEPNELELLGYLLEEDAAAISTYTGANQLAISFRKAGTATLNQLKKGAAAKGHDILEKSIKAKSLGLNEADGPQVMNHALLAAMHVVSPTDLNVWELLGGFVGHWKKDNPKVPYGLYLSKLGLAESRKGWAGQCEEIKDPAGKKHWILKLEGALPVIQTLSTEYGEEFPRLFYTGDYDMHDLLRVVASEPSIIPSDSLEEAMVINRINEEICGKASPARQASMNLTIHEENRENKEYQVIRHGPQVNYLAHMCDKEPTGEIVYVVADHSRDDWEIAACSNGKWELLQNVQDLNEWYTKNAAKLKWTWVWVQKLQDSIAKHISQQIYEYMREQGISEIKKAELEREVYARVDVKTDEAEKIKKSLFNKTEEYLIGPPSGAFLRREKREIEKKTETGVEMVNEIVYKPTVPVQPK